LVLPVPVVLQGLAKDIPLIQEALLVVTIHQVPLAVLRTFAYGFLSVILAIYLKLIGFNDLFIGFILTTTATLLNSVIFTLMASFYADRIGRRKVLIAY
jgi:MFS family permease